MTGDNSYELSPVYFFALFQLVAPWKNILLNFLQGKEPLRQPIMVLRATKGLICKATHPWTLFKEQKQMMWYYPIIRHEVPPSGASVKK